MYITGKEQSEPLSGLKPAERALKLGDLKLLIQADPALSQSRRSNLISSINTLGKRAGQDPALLAADAESIRGCLARIQPGPHRISDRRLRNITSDLRFVLARYTGLETAASGRRAGLNETWSRRILSLLSTISASGFPGSFSSAPTRTSPLGRWTRKLPVGFAGGWNIRL